MDTGWGRSVRPLGPFSVEVSAPREVVFDVIAAPYLGRTPRALAGKLDVIERGSDMVLAAHRTPVRPGLVATTVETVPFQRPDQVHFRLVRGPVPHVVEQFGLPQRGGQTALSYQGEMGADFWSAGRWRAAKVARLGSSSPGIICQHQNRGGTARREQAVNSLVPVLASRTRPSGKWNTGTEDEQDHHAQ